VYESSCFFLFSHIFLQYWTFQIWFSNSGNQVFPPRVYCIVDFCATLCLLSLYLWLMWPLMLLFDQLSTHLTISQEISLDAWDQYLSIFSRELSELEGTLLMLTQVVYSSDLTFVSCLLSISRSSRSNSS
jgi:hypothetical protein